MKVGDVMQAQARTCTPESNLQEVGRTMTEVCCGVLPVVDADGRVVGVLTDRDAFLALAAGDRRPSAIRVGEILAGDVYCCAADDDIGDALATMRRYRVRRLPVLDGSQRLRGILSLDAIVLALRPAPDAASLVELLAETLREINAPPLPVSLS